MLFFDLSPVDAAIDAITGFLNQTLFARAETIPLTEADTRVLARDIHAAENVPNYGKSTVDGFAVRASDTDGASGGVPAMVRLAGDIRMGEHVQRTLSPGETMRIPTGGMLPPGADAVVMAEDSDVHDSDVFFSRAVAPGMNTINSGEDIEQGARLFAAGTRLTPARIGALASLSQTTVHVVAKPRFAIISTGDEIRPFSEPLAIGQVRDSNAYVLASQIRRLGGELVFAAISRDNRDQLRTIIDRGLREADIILVSGGSSVGERDYTKAIFTELPDSRIPIHGLAAKPGKPTIVAMSRDKLLLGLPGHPASCSLIFQELAFPAFRRLGFIPNGPAPVEARLLENCHGSPGRRTFQTVTLHTDERGEMTCRPLRGQSGLVSLLATAAGYFIIEADSEGAKAGSIVSVTTLDGGFHG